MTSVGLSFLVMLIGVALVPVGVLTGVLMKTRRDTPGYKWWIITALAYVLAAYTLLALVVILPSDSTVQNVAFFASISATAPLGLGVLFLATRPSREPSRTA